MSSMVSIRQLFCSTENIAHPWQGCPPKRALKVCDAHMDKALIELLQKTALR